jgi:hypothetical protein
MMQNLPEAFHRGAFSFNAQGFPSLKVRDAVAAAPYSVLHHFSFLAMR